MDMRGRHQRVIQPWMRLLIENIQDTYKSLENLRKNHCGAKNIEESFTSTTNASTNYIHQIYSKANGSSNKS